MSARDYKLIALNCKMPKPQATQAINTIVAHFDTGVLFYSAINPLGIYATRAGAIIPDFRLLNPLFISPSRIVELFTKLYNPRAYKRQFSGLLPIHTIGFPFHFKKLSFPG